MTPLAIALVWYFVSGGFTAWLVCIPGALINPDGTMRARPEWFVLAAIVGFWPVFCVGWFVNGLR